jgi:predicted RNA binding protein YcfA (HicA-like mRNA interferase family)
VLRRLGWQKRNQRGSHLVLIHPQLPGRVVVPMHAGETLKPKTLASILDQAGLNVEDLRRAL